MTIATILILAAIDQLYWPLAWRHRPIWTDGPGEAAYRSYVRVSTGLLVAASLALIALAISLP